VRIATGLFTHVVGEERRKKDYPKEKYGCNLLKSGIKEGRRL
jgi:hypothetical protein